MKIFLRTYAIFFVAIIWAFLLFFIYYLKHNFQFQTFGLDTGFFDQIIYKASVGDFSASTISRWSFFADHFQPILLLFIPFYWLKPSIYWLFGGEALIFSLSVIPLFFMSLKLTKSYLLSYALSFAYLILVPSQHGIFDGFSQSVFVSLFLALSYYALTAKNNNLLALGLVGLLLVKEEFSLLVSGLGLVIFLFYGRKRLGIIVSVIGILFFLFLTKIVNPWISPYDLNYAHQNVGYGRLGANTLEVIVNIVKAPWLVPLSFFDSDLKISTVLNHLLTFGFLPFLAPTHLVLLIQQYLLRFLNYEEPIKWLAHDFAFGPILFVSSVYGFVNLSKKIKLDPALTAVLIIFSACLANGIYHGPINSLLKKDFYFQPTWAKNNLEIISQISADASISTNNSLVPHFSTRKFVYLFPNVNNAQYVILDLSNSPNAYAPIDYNQTVRKLTELVSTKDYKIIKTQGKVVVLEKL